MKMKKKWKKKKSVVRRATFSVTGVRKTNFSSLKVARLYPLVLLVGGLEARWSVGK
jgi:hypothetical protein